MKSGTGGEKMEQDMRRSWQLRVFTAVALVNLVVIIVIAAFFTRRTLSYFEEEFAGALYSQAVEAGAGLDGAWQSLYHIAATAAADGEVRRLATAGEHEAIARLLQSYRAREHLIDRVCYYDIAGATLVRSDDYQSVLVLDAERAARWLAVARSQAGTEPLLTTDLLGPAAKNIYTYSAEVHSPSGETIGYITVSGAEQQLYYEALARIQSAAGGRCVALYTSTGEPMGSLGAIAPPAVPELANLDRAIAATREGEMHAQLAGERYLAVWLPLPFSEVRLALLRSESALQSRMVNMQVICVLAAVLLLIVSDIGLYLIAMRLARPVEELARTLEDEREQKKAAELKALQYQIRPHFIYNMLNAIRFAASLKGAHSIADRLADFVELLRASTNRQGSFVELAGELATLQHYIALQEFRLLDAFTVEFAVGDDIKDCIVPRMILQPLVENSILHGPSRERPYCHIVVAGEIDRGTLHLTVRDDGQGMSAEAIEAVLAGERRELSHGGLSGIGTANIVERLRLYYGGSASLTYESDGATYTAAHLRLPVSHDIHEYEL